MNLRINHFAIPNRRALAVPERERDWLRKNFSGLIDEYQFDYGTLHPPYKAKDPRKRLTQVLHPLFVRRQLVQRANRSLTFAHVTDTHVNVRDDVYEENLRRAEQPMSWDGRQLRYREIPLRHNNFNRSFERIYAEAKRGADFILMTGDLIDYGRATSAS
jgi:hypothetical protein